MRDKPHKRHPQPHLLAVPLRFHALTANILFVSILSTPLPVITLLTLCQCTYLLFFAKTCNQLTSTVRVGGARAEDWGVAAAGWVCRRWAASVHGWAGHYNELAVLLYSRQQQCSLSNHIRSAVGEHVCVHRERPLPRRPGLCAIPGPTYRWRGVYLTD